MTVNIISHTPCPETVVAAAGKLCYSELDAEEILEGMTPESAGVFVKRLSEMGHESPLEHASFTFSVSGVSRSLLAQITRHRVASFSVKSQRYVDMRNFDPVIPEAISKNPNALRAFDDAINRAALAYQNIHDYLLSSKLMENWGDSITCDNPKYFYLSIESYMNKADEVTKKQYKRDLLAAEKFANENARSILPNAAPTNMVFTMNARELLHFFRLRCCNRAQDEIRRLADEMLVLCMEIAPNIFRKAGAPCVSGACPEGKMSCGTPRGVE